MKMMYEASSDNFGITQWPYLCREKAEAARKQRLTKVKPTVSNHVHPAIEKKLPKKQEKETHVYLDALQSAASNESFYDSLVRFHSNQEQPRGPPDSPFSVHNVVERDSFFHPESQIEAFKGLKKEPQSKEDPEYPPSRERPDSVAPKELPPPSRSTKSRTKHEKLPSLKSSVGKRDVYMTSTRSDPDLSQYADPRRRHVDTDALDLFTNQSQRSESAPSSTLLSSKSDQELRGDAVPKLNLKPLSREVKDAKTARRQSNHDDKSDGKAERKGKKNSGRGRSGTSLADLRDEHKAALELLNELGGAYPDEKDEKPVSSRFGSKLRSTVRHGRESDESNNESVVEAAPKAGDEALDRRESADEDDEVPEAQSPEKSTGRTSQQVTSARSRRSESYGSEEFETD
ncbi:Aste57867_9668 [Aphanomyces stellatus]|uniref:Aste57867_9668 protein n=1 Tax=Aphanomyces stellatus TaxID=120398 RepID=A0A485KP16_9STRA|nr:hypothetical protein As57867_009630 [Aphanomyces stellatus]VFT86547.1 Aste57867_9668 [Aphanomyces stellatus]